MFLRSICHAPKRQSGRGREDGSGLALAHIEGGDGARPGLFLVGQLYLAELALIAHDVLLQGHEQAFGVLGGEDNAALNLRLGHTGQYACEVEHEVAAGMGDEGEDGRFALGCLLGQLYLELALLVFVFVHFCFKYFWFKLS